MLLRILIKCLTGILLSIFFFVGSAIVVPFIFSNLASTNSFTNILPEVVMLSGTVAGFYIGYSRTLKKDAEEIDNKQLVRKLAILVVVFLIIGILGYIIYLNIRGYNKFSYYVYASEENVFASKIDPKNQKIIDHGRMIKKKIISMDNKIDNGDGPQTGKVRWYDCYGIDCDEGWENRSYN